MNNDVDLKDVGEKLKSEAGNIDLTALAEKQKSEAKAIMHDKIKDWALSTTAHGIPGVAKSTKTHTKILWIIFTVVSFGLCAYLLAKSIMQYLEFDVTSKIREDIRISIPFPTVSVCNVNPMVTPEANQFIRDYFNAKYNLNVTTYEELYELRNQTISYEMSWLIYRTYYPNFNNTLRQSFGYGLGKFIQFASFNNVPLNLFTTFNWFYHPIFGNCFRLNSFSENYEGQGLKMKLFAGVPESMMNYFYSSTSTRGFQLIIQDETSNSLLAEGILIEPGQYTKISLKRIESDTLPAPYSQCVDPSSVNTVMGLEMKRLNITYNRQMCLELSAAKFQIEKLGCYSLRYPRIFNAMPCVSKEKYNDTLNMIYDLKSFFDQCPFECKTVDYKMTISQQSYPFYTDFVNNYLLNKLFYQRLFMTENVTLDMFKYSMASVFIQIEDLKVTSITESPTMTLPDLLANLGGTLGLFLGVSILSFVEFIELTIEIPYLVSKSMKKRKINTNDNKAPVVYV